MKCDASLWSARAQAAADAVNGGFGHRLLGLPGTWIASVRHPSAPAAVPRSAWHYWWQAQYLDALVDSGWRHDLRSQGTAGTGTETGTGSGSPGAASTANATGSRDMASAASAPTAANAPTAASAPTETPAPPAPTAPTEPPAPPAPTETQGATAVAGQKTRPDPLRLATNLLRTMRLRNFLRLTNSYYDDMAWLALAVGRADALARNRPAKRMPGELHTGHHRGPYDGCHPGLPGARRAAEILGAQLARAHTTDLGGGIFWSRKRDFKNTPATGTSALYFARNGQPERAQSLVDWLRETLYDPSQGLYLDGVHPHPAGPEIERTIYSYNQGPVLGTLLKLGGQRNLAHAADLIDAVALHLTANASPLPDARHCINNIKVNDDDDARVALPGNPTLPDGAALPDGAPAPAPPASDRRRPLRLHGTGDGGLFTGILIRYLTLAATRTDLPGRSRRLAAAMVLDTAEQLWAGRRPDLYPVFSSDINLPAAVSHPPGAPVELSTQLQAWVSFECAFQLCSTGSDRAE